MKIKETNKKMNTTFRDESAPIYGIKLNILYTYIHVNMHLYHLQKVPSCHFPVKTTSAVSTI